MGFLMRAWKAGPRAGTARQTKGREFPAGVTLRQSLLFASRGSKEKRAQFTPCPRLGATCASKRHFQHLETYLTATSQGWE